MIVLKHPKIKGDMQLDKSDLKETIGIKSCSWKLGRDMAESGLAGTKDLNLGMPEWGEATLEMSKSMDVSSPYLMQHAIAGEAMDQSAEIFFLTTSGTDSAGEWFLKFELQNPVIKSWSISGSEDERPEETFEMWYRAIKMTYKHTEDGKTYKEIKPLGWDRVANKAWA
ncbi:MAG: type VI secretion system tube protein Hcp [Planctomycetota bacterium]